MNISQENNGELTATIHINLGEEDYIESVNKQLAEYKKKTNMPGFRPGKVPLGLVKKMVGKNILAEEINKKVSDALNSYIVDNNINVLGYPLPNKEKTTPLDFDHQKDFDFYFDIGIAPEFEFTLSDNIEVPYYKIKASKEDVEKAIEDMKVRFATEEYPEKAEETDGLQGIFSELDAEGNLVEDGIGKKSYFKINDIKLTTIISKFTGKGNGDTVDFNPMKAFEDESKVMSLLNLQDKQEDKLSTDYRFTIEKVVRSTNAEPGEELYNKVYPGQDIKTEEDFKNKIAEEIEKHYATDADNQLINDAIDVFIKTTDLPIPDDFMKRWLVESNDGKITVEQVEEQYESYGKTIRWSLIESKLVTIYGEKASVSDEDIRSEVRKYFVTPGEEYKPNPQVEEVISNILSNPEEKQRIYNSLQNQKLSKLFKENLGLKEKEVTSEKFIEIVSNTK
ncbi:MAG TPA: trigger factor [Bacteroidetes bacterium]|nr:trigger factor [Bacteroidota bacterium]